MRNKIKDFISKWWKIQSFSKFITFMALNPIISFIRFPPRKPRSLLRG